MRDRVERLLEVHEAHVDLVVADARVHVHQYSVSGL